MSDGLKLFLVDMIEHPHYRDFIELIEQHRPERPVFDPVKDNTEIWKAKSSMQKGYDLFASLLNITFGD